MKKGLTELVMILDRSGSMQGLEKDTIGGYNGMLEKQKKEDGSILVSTVFFNNTSEVIHDRTPVSEVRPITEKEYYVGGCTALLDAVGGAVKHIATVHKYAREEDKPENTIFVIITDGMENASRYYDYDEVKRLIEQQKESAGWEFIFLGANIDAVQVAGKIGIAKERAAEYFCDSAGTALNYEVLGETVSMMTDCGGIPMPNWKERIEEDLKSRGRNKKKRT